MHESAGRSPFWRTLWIGPSLGLLAGTLLGVAAGLHAVRAQRYFQLELDHLGWSVLGTEIRAFAVPVILLLFATQLAIAGWRALQKPKHPLTETLVALVLGLGLAGALLYRLNTTTWFPGGRTPLGLILNGILLGLPIVWALLLGRRHGPTAIGAWLETPAARRWAGLGGVAALLIVGAVRGASALAAPAHKEDPPHVVLITIDTLRYDHMSLHGYERRTTPNIDALGAGGVVFSQATTPRPKTTPSMASLLTGLYPHHHGVRRLVDQLDARFVTLAEAFRNSGYRTGAVICNYVVGRASGLGAGFDWYDDETPENGGTQRDSKPATDRAIAWLERNAGAAPVFLWIHYMDPHGPYASPAPFSDTFVSETRGTRTAPPDEIPEASRLGDHVDIDYYVDQYDGEILYTDHHVQRLLATLGELGIDNNTIVALTADHGESLGEHDYYFEHGKFLYDTCSRIPLILSYPGGPEDLRLDSPVEIIDLYPTLLELAGVPTPASSDGVSLTPLLGGGPSPRSEVAYIERYTMMKAARTPEWKLIHTYGEDGEVARHELYDLVADPGEGSDLYDQRPEIVARLEEPLLSWVGDDAVMAVRPGHEGEGEGAHVSDKVLEKLRALGYVQ